MNTTEQLVQAADEGDCERVYRLLQEGAPVDVASRRHSALDRAVVNNHPAVVRVLLEAGADPEQVVGEYHESLPLRFAATRGMTQIVGLLLAAGAQSDGRLDEQQGTALSIASAQGHVDIVKILLDHGASINGLGDAPSDPLGSAAWSGQVEVVRLLLHRGAVATPGALDSVRRGRATAESQAEKGHYTAQQLAELLARYRAVTALLEHAMA